ncbi:MAG: hypothetical protein A3E79_11215 [Burkholderiales bacterium RIFCSPHIGHO2_12_FULL_61_11]|nr:MAG: hypothetical protein A3E79_11215 [Burkholderiales bacterium RIFCSPHIGHO2_12_FULL_61_11]
MKNARYRWLWLFILLVAVGSAASLAVALQWDDVKLKLTRLWGYRTLENNPLLPAFNRDLKPLNTAQARINLDELLAGGPPKDGIPALDHPAFDTPLQTPFPDDERVLGVFINGQAKAYPYSILNWHEIVNDSIGGVPVSVTYCPLCETGIVFERRVGGKETSFGVSGKLFQSCLVMYDRLTDSLWSQPWGLGVVGPHVNESLKRYPAMRTTLGLWKKVHPATSVLSANTGSGRDYFRYPYGSYYTSDALIFPVRNTDRVAGSVKAIESYYWAANEATPQNQFAGLSVHFSWQEVAQKKRVVQSVGNRRIEARWDVRLQSVRLFENDHELAGSAAFAFVYPAFFP